MGHYHHHHSRTSHRRRKRLETGIFILFYFTDIYLQLIDYVSTTGTTTTTLVTPNDNTQKFRSFTASDEWQPK